MDRLTTGTLESLPLTRTLTLAFAFSHMPEAPKYAAIAVPLPIRKTFS